MTTLFPTDPFPLQGLCFNLLVILRYKEDNLVQPGVTTQTLQSISIVSPSVRAPQWFFMHFLNLEMALDDVDERPSTVRRATFKFTSIITLYSQIFRHQRTPYNHPTMTPCHFNPQILCLVSPLSYSLSAIHNLFEGEHVWV